MNSELQQQRIKAQQNRILKNVLQEARRLEICIVIDAPYLTKAQNVFVARHLGYLTTNILTSVKPFQTNFQNLDVRMWIENQIELVRIDLAFGTQQK